MFLFVKTMAREDSTERHKHMQQTVGQENIPDLGGNSMAQHRTRGSQECLGKKTTEDNFIVALKVSGHLPLLGTHFSYSSSSCLREVKEKTS